MAEIFLKRLEHIETSIKDINDSMARLVKLFGAFTEIKVDMEAFKEEILARINEFEAKVGASEGGGAASVDLAGFEEKFDELAQKIDAIAEKVEEILSSGAKSAAGAVEGAEGEKAETFAIPGSPTEGLAIPPDRAKPVVDILRGVIAAMKFGVTSGELTEKMENAKAEIIKYLPSDPVLVKIDQWINILMKTPKRNEVKTRDIRFLKTEVNSEIERIGQGMF